jgi:hypothetical protein
MLFTLKRGCVMKYQDGKLALTLYTFTFLTVLYSVFLRHVHDHRIFIFHWSSFASHHVFFGARSISSISLV